MSFEAIKFGQSSQRVRFVQAYAGSFNNGYSILSGNVLVVGQWSHLVGVHREDVGIELYLDGVLIGSDNTKTAADGTALISHGTQVGTTYHHNLAVFAGLRPFRGDIDEVRMYNYALTGAQVAASFAEGCASDLIGQWHLDEGEGEIAFDSSGSGIDGDIFGATWIEDGICGSALNFDGAGPPFDYVSFVPHHGLTDAINSQVPRDYTVAAWIRPASLPFNTRRDVMSFKAMELGLADERVTFRQAYQGGWPKGYSIVTGNVLVVGQWSHLVGVHREDVGIEVYLDGVLIGSDNTKTAKNGTATISHGTQVGTTYHHNLAVFAGLRAFDGDIDEIHMYKKALTQDEIDTLFADAETCEK